jgi:hypothetical protein
MSRATEKLCAEWVREPIDGCIARICLMQPLPTFIRRMTARCDCAPRSASPLKHDTSEADGGMCGATTSRGVSKNVEAT